MDTSEIPKIVIGYKKNHTSWSSRILQPRRARMVQYPRSVNVINYYQLKESINHVVVSTDTEKVLNKIKIHSW